MSMISKTTRYRTHPQRGAVSVDVFWAFGADLMKGLILQAARQHCMDGRRGYSLRLTGFQV